MWLTMQTNSKMSSDVCKQEVRGITAEVILEILCIHYVPFMEDHHYNYWHCVFLFSMYLMLTFHVSDSFCQDQ